MGGTGLLHSDASGCINNDLQHDNKSGGAESGAVDRDSVASEAIDADLALLVERWPALPDTIKATIMILVQRGQT